MRVKIFMSLYIRDLILLFSGKDEGLYSKYYGIFENTEKQKIGNVMFF